MHYTVDNKLIINHVQVNVTNVYAMTSTRVTLPTAKQFTKNCSKPKDGGKRVTICKFGGEEEGMTLLASF